MILVSLLIKLFDNGPIIFKQKRIGLNNNNFYIYKFRSMPLNTSNIPSDEISELNLNWLSNLIRRTNIDELPQFYNILKGDMSVVGPRPALPSQKELIDFRKKNGVMLFRPGLTGLAQISAYDGMQNNIKVEYDVKYVRSITFMSDIFIILKTLIYLLKPPPIY